MEKAERTRYKHLANDAVVATFGEDSDASRLAQALEACVDELEFIADECDCCKTCPAHGDHTDEMLPIDADEILRIHGEMKKSIATFKDLHVKFAGALTEREVDDLVEKLASEIEEVESCVDELEAEVLP
jgi:uncharacterized protein Yka (UPF0111/DUF47 family)